MPLQPAGIRVKSQNAARIEVVTRSNRSIIVGGWIARRPEESIGFDIICSRHPGRTAAEVRRISCPGRTSQVRFLRNSPEPPEFGSRGGIVSIEEARQCTLSGSDTYNDLPINSQ